jgi:predicted acetyltransferase
MTVSFAFMLPRRLVDDELELTLVRRVPADLIKRHGPSYEFEMRHRSKKVVMGSIRLRIGSARSVRYPGHIGFEVKPKFRGNRYAARSTSLLLPLASAHGLKAVWLTTDPQNVPSLKTLGFVGAQYVETVRVPPDHAMFLQGERYLRRYRVDLRKKSSNNSRGCVKTPGRKLGNDPE